MSERLLIRYPLFELLDHHALESVLSESVTTDFDTGEVLFLEGTTAAWVHFLVEGRVRIVRRTESGREVSLGMVREGELFGEYVLLSPHQHTATCRAASRCRVLRMPVGPLRTVLSQSNVDGNLLKPLIRLHASMGFATGRHFLGFMSARSALTYSEFLKREQFRPMRTLCGPGLAKDRWFLICAGNALLSDQFRGCLELGPGDCFGSLCLTGRCSEETVSTLSDVQCLSLTFSDFQKPDQSGHTSPIAANSGPYDESQQSVITRHLPQARFPFCTQRNQADCGLAALSMVGEFLGIPVRDIVYEMAVQLPEQGLSLLELRDLARSFPFLAEAYRIDSEHLSDVSRPFIAHLKNGHYVVVYHIDCSAILFADPATSIQSMAGQSFISLWSGYVITVQRQAAPATEANQFFM